MPLVSIIIVNYNAQPYLEKCLASIAKNSFQEYEVIVVDNGSERFEHTPLTPLIPHSPLKLIKLENNKGPAYARNLAAKKAKGKYLAFLDNDTEVHKDWLTNAVKVMESNSNIGALQCKLLLNKHRERFDYAGDYLTQWGFLAQVIEANTKDTNQVPEGLEILAAKSAGMLIRKDTFIRVGRFDEDYFIYVEETDLSWRVWLAGKKVVFTNESVVYHEFGTTNMLNPKLGSKNVKYHGTKNYLTTLIKNLSVKELIKILPLHLICWLGIASVHILRGQFRDTLYIFQGIAYNVIHLPKILEKRFAIQQSRQVSDTQIFPVIFKKVSLSYFINKLTGRSEAIGNAKGW